MDSPAAVRPEATVWLDLVSPSHPFLFRPVVSGIESAKFNITVREKTETVRLSDINGFDFDVVGRDFDNPLLRKVGIPYRTAQLIRRAPAADISLSARNAMCVLASKARGIPSIHFTDNDVTAYAPELHVEELYNFFESCATHLVVPEAFQTDVLLDFCASPEQIHTFDGYKEDIYVADLEPDHRFSLQLPFDEYIVVRPEALDAAYVSDEISIVPTILGRAHEEGMNVVYLPRGRHDEQFADPYPPDRVYTPDDALDGLQLAWHSNGVLTGSGTMAREAACMGKPAVSFFPNDLISVDRCIIREGRMLHSRDPDEIIGYLQSFTEREREPDLTRSRRVQEDVVQLLEWLIADSVPGDVSQYEPLTPLTGTTDSSLWRL